MKLSKMDTNRAADAMIQIAPDIEILLSDNELIDKFKNRKKTDSKEEAKKLGMATILKIAVYLLKEHRDKTWNILGALNQKTAEEIGDQLIPVTIKQIIELLSDDDLIGFFSLSKPSEPETQSGI